MSDQCELCGARLEPGASVCRECGSAPQPRPPLPKSESSGSATTATLASTRPTNATDLSGLGRNRTRLWAGVAAVGLVTIVVITAVALSGSDSNADPDAQPETQAHATPTTPSSDCPELEALGGSWMFTTLSTGARRQKRLGMRGFYELEVHVQDCEAEIDLVMIGRTAAKSYDEARKQHATGPIHRGEGRHAFGYGGFFEPSNEAGQGIPKRFTFAVDGDRLVGTWQQRGEWWTKSGQYGVLEGYREGDPRELRPRRTTMPCTIACAVPKDITEADAPLDSAALQACRAACQ